MAQRGVSNAAVSWVLDNYHTRRPAPHRPQAEPAEIFVGTYNGEEIKVYVGRDSDPMLVKTVYKESE
jgi:hypothetical protein